MNKPLMEVVLPRLARPLYHQLEKLHSGKVDETQFAEMFESLLRRQHAWLSRRGINAAKGGLAIYAGGVVLSLPGLRSEAEEAGLPMEVVEHRAACEAALDVASSYGVPYGKAVDRLSTLVARYAQ